MAPPNQGNNINQNTFPQWDRRQRGYGPAPASRQQGRFVPYVNRQGVNRRSFDPEMTLDAAMQTGWNGASFYQQQQPRNNELNRTVWRNGIAVPHPVGGTNYENPVGAANFVNPTARQGAFAQGMAQISCNPSAAAQGSVLTPNNLSKKLFEQIQLALALKMCLNGPQQVK